ncbi:MAG: hypothetical protein EXS05_08070 [Planctomycetaceae bacterium]|nr:hypothetical protein [Planctomycetaceae bacterium]
MNRTLTNGVIELDPITILPPSETDSGMEPFAGQAEFQMGDVAAEAEPIHLRSVPAFLLDRTEVPIERIRKLDPGYAEKFKAEKDLYALTDVTFNKALELAESLGKRLPEEAEYEYAATNGGQTQYPWGEQPIDPPGWPIDPAGRPQFDRCRDHTSVAGLYSNVLEWTISPLRSYPASTTAITMRAADSDRKIVRGAPVSVLLEQADNPEEWARGPRQRFGMNASATHERLGFRCARSAKPRIREADFGRPVWKD